VSSGGGGERPGRSRALREETEGRPLCRPGEGGTARTEPGPPRRSGGTTSVSSGGGGNGPDGAGPSKKKRRDDLCVVRGRVGNGPDGAGPSKKKRRDDLRVVRGRVGNGPDGAGPSNKKRMDDLCVVRGRGERPGRSRALREDTEGRPLCRPGEGGERPGRSRALQEEAEGGTARTEPGPPRRSPGGKINRAKPRNEFLLGRARHQEGKRGPLAQDFASRKPISIHRILLFAVECPKSHAARLWIRERWAISLQTQISNRPSSF